METAINKPKTLIVYGYHPKETFAVKVGEILLDNFSVFPIKVVKYEGNQDENKSTCHLRRFIDKFDPLILPIILHSDENFDVKIKDNNANAIIIYFARSRQEKEEILKFLFDFILEYNKKKVSIIFDVVFIHNARRSLVEIEFNPKMKLDEAINLVNNFSKYVPDF